MTTMMMMKRALTGLSLFTETGYYMLVLPDPDDVQSLETVFLCAKNGNISKQAPSTIDRCKNTPRNISNLVSKSIVEPAIMIFTQPHNLPQWLDHSYNFFLMLAMIFSPKPSNTIIIGSFSNFSDVKVLCLNKFKLSSNCPST